MQAVRKAAIEAKILLSTELMARFDIELPNGDRYQREIPREVFELLIEPVLARTAGPCRQALTDAGITPEQIDEVVLVGGSTRIPAVRQLVDKLFHLSARGKKPHIELNPDEVVARLHSRDAAVVVFLFLPSTSFQRVAGRIGSLATLRGNSRVSPRICDALRFGRTGASHLLISTMAMHTQNLKADPRASLLVTQDEAVGDPLRSVQSHVGGKCSAGTAGGGRRGSQTLRGALRQ